MVWEQMPKVEKVHGTKALYQAFLTVNGCRRTLAENEENEKLRAALAETARFIHRHVIFDDPPYCVEISPETLDYLQHL